MRHIFEILLSFLVLLSTSFVTAKDVELYTYDTQTQKYLQSINYDDLIHKDNILPDDIIHIGEHSFQVTKYLGSGNTTMVFLVKNVHSSGRKVDGEYVLRLPLRTGKYTGKGVANGTPIKDFINKTIQGIPLLNSFKIPIPAIKISEPDIFILSEVIQYNFELKDFLLNPESLPQGVERSTVELSLIEFFKKSAFFEYIDDFHDGQLVYNIKDNKWVLIDWTEKHRIIKSFDSLEDSISTFFKNENGEYKIFNGNREIITPSNRVIDLFQRINMMISKERLKEKKWTFQKLDSAISLQRNEGEESAISFINEHIDHFKTKELKTAFGDAVVNWIKEKDIYFFSYDEMVFIKRHFLFSPEVSHYLEILNALLHLSSNTKEYLQSFAKNDLKFLFTNEQLKEIQKIQKHLALNNYPSKFSYKDATLSELQDYMSIPDLPQFLKAPLERRLKLKKGLLSCKEILFGLSL